jgi:hypothetical protein
LVTPWSRNRLRAALRQAARLAGARSDLTGVLAERDVPDVVQAVLDLSVAAPELFQLHRICLLRRQASQGLRPLLARCPGLSATDVFDFAVDAADRSQP